MSVARKNDPVQRNMENEMPASAKFPNREDNYVLHVNDDAVQGEAVDT